MTKKPSPKKSPAKKPAKASKPATPAKATPKADAAPKISGRTAGYIAAVRKAMPDLKQTDEQIADAVWRVASVEKALEKAKAAFK